MKQRKPLSPFQWFIILVFIGMVSVVGWQMTQSSTQADKAHLSWEQVTQQRADSSLQVVPVPQAPYTQPESEPAKSGPSAKSLIPVVLDAALQLIIKLYPQQG